MNGYSDSVAVRLAARPMIQSTLNPHQEFFHA